MKKSELKQLIKEVILESKINTWDDLSDKAGLTAKEEESLMDLVNTSTSHNDFMIKMKKKFGNQKAKLDILINYYSKNKVGSGD